MWGRRGDLRQVGVAAVRDKSRSGSPVAQTARVTSRAVAYLNGSSGGAPMRSIALRPPQVRSYAWFLPESPIAEDSSGACGRGAHGLCRRVPWRETTRTGIRASRRANCGVQRGVNCSVEDA